MKKESIKKWWNKLYAIVIPVLAILSFVVINWCQKFEITQLCQNDAFDDMLTAIITSMSIVISIFGFLMPSLISAKNDKMVKYFIENADMSLFVKKIKGVVCSGLIGIAMSVVLYLHSNLLPIPLTIYLYVWIGVILNFVCNSYRFICIIIDLLLTEKSDEPEKKCINTLPDDKVERLNNKLKQF